MVAEGCDHLRAVVCEAVEEQQGGFVQQQPGFRRRRSDNVPGERDERGSLAGIRHAAFEVRSKHRCAPGRFLIEVLPDGQLTVEVVDREDLDVYRCCCRGRCRAEVARECDGGENDEQEYE
ncbi:hypothetical protein [Methanoculleus sp.]|uniref:hypothetical protein n=1 Tax=Methanoculleus sp. TaxID=90427 RepID=UPI00261FB48A|nr:hypothetical protein [Methanoculleus sp.]